MSLYAILENRTSHIYPEEGYEPDLQGWMPTQFPHVFKNALVDHGKTDETVIVEVGTWKGTSAIEMATICKDLGYKNTKIICVDTWLGSPEHFTEIGKYGDIFNTFVKNVKSKGLDDIIFPLSLPSIQAADVLMKYLIKPDIIYVDAAHEYLPAKMDIETYWKILKPGGIMLGDDYFPPSWPGVVQAVDEFINTNNLNGKLLGSTWSIKKVESL